MPVHEKPGHFVNTSGMENSTNSDRKHPRMLPDLIDEYASQDPSGVYAWAPVASSNFQNRFREITYKELATAVNCACSWLDTVLGRESTFAYSGLNDSRYPVLIAAAARSGRRILIPGKSLTLGSASTFLERFNCRYILCSEGSTTLPRDKRLRKARHLFVPEVEEWLDCDEAQAYPFEKTWDENSGDVFLIAHTSGTTGHPKPLSYSHAAIGCFDILERLQSHKDSDRLSLTSMSGERVHSPLSFAHNGGSFLNLFFPLYLKYVAVFGPLDGWPTARTVRKAVTASEATGAALTPYLLNEILHDPSALVDLQSLEFVISFTAPLERKTGDHLSKYVKLRNYYGSLETGAPLSWVIDEPADWEYVSFHPDSGMEMVYREQNLYEAVQIRRPDLAWNQVVFRVFPELDKFCTKDLFSPHREKEGLWKYQGRAEEAVTLTGSPSSRIHVAPFEKKIEEHWMVKDAMIGGTGRPQLFVLIELIDFARKGRVDHVTKDPKLLENGETEIVWRGPVTKVNRDLAEYGVKIEKDKIIMSSMKRFLRTTKGSVDRNRTIESFQQEIDAVFQDHPMETDPVMNDLVSRLALTGDREEVKEGGKDLCMLTSS